jgi:hypothetical protein
MHDSRPQLLRLHPIIPLRNPFEEMLGRERTLAAVQQVVELEPEVRLDFVRQSHDVQLVHGKRGHVMTMWCKKFGCRPQSSIPLLLTAALG